MLRIPLTYESGYRAWYCELFCAWGLPHVYPVVPSWKRTRVLSTMSMTISAAHGIAVANASSPTCQQRLKLVISLLKLCALRPNVMELEPLWFGQLSAATLSHNGWDINRNANYVNGPWRLESKQSDGAGHTPVSQPASQAATSQAANHYPVFESMHPIKMTTRLQILGLESNQKTMRRSTHW